MFIRHLKVKGPGKPDAVVTFSNGVNVIAGASDTGKSYIVQCIKFLLGGKKPPKPIGESDGYTSAELRLVLEGKEISVERELFEKSKLVVTEHPGDVRIVMAADHKKGAYDNISNYLLREVGLADKELLYNKSGVKRAFSLRYFERVFLIDEARVISEDSPWGEGQYLETVIEPSMAKLLMTGVDASEHENIEKNKISANTLRIQIEMLSELAAQKQKMLEGYNLTSDQVDESVNKIDIAIAKIDEESRQDDVEIETFTQRRESSVSKARELEEQKREIETYISRFSLLKEKYESDRERLESIGQAGSYMAEYDIQACPTCGGAFNIEAGSDIDTEMIVESTNAEIRKLNVLLEDLQTGMAELRSRKVGIENMLMVLAEEEREMAKAIALRFAPRNEERLKGLKELYERKSQLSAFQEAKAEADKLLIKVGDLSTRLSGINVEKAGAVDDVSYDDLVHEVSTLLEHWGFPKYRPVSYDVKKRDIVIGGKPRSHFGKGYRAIGFTSFAIGLMDCLMKSHRHIGFTIIDSPLTTYKGPDSGEDESIASDMVYAFYRDLADRDREGQIIILDNQEPDVELTTRMHYEHFSGRHGVGRAGFFPSGN